MPPDIGTMPEVPAHSATSDAPAVESEPKAPAAPPPEADPPAPVVEPPAPEEGEAGEEGEAPPPAAAPSKKFGERLSEMAAQRRAAEEGKRAADARADKLADSLEKAVDALSRQQQRPAAEQQEQPDPRPSRETFADPDAYDSALVEWSARTATKLAAAEFERREAENREKTQREEGERRSREQFEAATARWGEARAKLMADPQYEDFAEVAEAESLTITHTMVPALLAAENGPQVLYHLGKHPAEATRIAGLDPMRQAIEIGRISASLEQTSRPPLRKPIPAVEPVGSRSPAGPKDPNEMTTEEWAAKRMGELQSERRAGMWGRPAH